MSNTTPPKESRIRWWLVHLLPRTVAIWLWRAEDIPLGHWGPYILGRALGAQNMRRVK